MGCKSSSIGTLWIGFIALFAIAATPALATLAPAGWQLAIAVGLGLVLSLLSAIDLKTLRLPDVLTLPLIIAGLAVTYALGIDDVLWRLAAAVAGAALLYVVAEIFRRARGVDALGLGDVKLFAAAGAWVGFDGLPSVLLLSSASALLVAALTVAVGGTIDRTTRIPFGPFLAGGFWLAWLYGPNVLL